MLLRSASIRATLPTRLSPRNRRTLVAISAWKRDAGLHFLTGTENSIQALTEAVGFHYRFDSETNQYVHASGIMVATPDGKLSRYFYGIDYSPRDVRLGLVEASENKIGSPVDQVLLFCFHYDPVTGKYGPVIIKHDPSGRTGDLRRRGHHRACGATPLQCAEARGVRVIVMEMNGISDFGFRISGNFRIWDCEIRNGRLPVKSAIRNRNPQFLFFIPFAPDQASTVSGTVDELYAFLVGLTFFFSVLITALIIYFALKYRRRSDDEYPRPIEGSMKLETVWIVIPFIIVMVIFVWGASVYFAVFRPPEEALDVYVVGKQWMWKFEHPDGQREINELHVPIGRRVKLTMATEDVIHAVFVPAFRVKADVVPGRYTSIWFEPTKPGRYHLFCAEYCGTGHSKMIGWVEVMTPADYQAWLSGGAREEPLAVRGQKVFTSLACNNCHRVMAPVAVLLWMAFSGNRWSSRQARRWSPMRIISGSRS